MRARASVIPPQETQIRLLAIAPDASYVYFGDRSVPFAEEVTYRVPAVGGERRRVFDRVLDLALSVDGSRLAAILPAPRYSLVIANADGTEARTLVTLNGEEMFAPAWSHDGRHVIASVRRAGTRREQLTAFAATDGTRQPIGNLDWSVYSVVSPPGDNDLIVAARDWSATDAVQLWSVSWRGGSARRLTSDTNSYNQPAVLSADGQTITTALLRDDVSLYSAPADRPDQATPLTGDTPQSGLGFLVPLWDGRLLYNTRVRGQRALWTMATDGTRRQRITPEGLDIVDVFAAARADVVVIQDLGATRRLWRMDTNGGGLTELPGDGTVDVAGISPDGGYMYYRKRDSTGRSGNEYLRRRLDGGPEEPAGQQTPAFSLDGRLFHRWADRVLPNETRHIEVVDAARGRVVRTLTAPNNFGNLSWAPSSDAVLAVQRADNVPNIWRVPIDGGPATQLTRFGPGQFNGSFIYTADGKLLFQILRRTLISQPNRPRPSQRKTRRTACRQTRPCESRASTAALASRP